MTAKGAGLLGFIVGLAAGSAATYFYIKSKNEVIEYEPEEAKPETPKPIDISDDNVFAPSPVDVKKRNDIVKDNGYSEKILSYSEAYNNSVELQKDQIEASKANGPYSIDPVAFGEYPEYSKFTLKYYKDGTILDEQNDPLDDIEGTIGDDFADHFGEYEEDMVYIRNDALKSDFEIMYIDYDFMDG